MRKSLKDSVFYLLESGATWKTNKKKRSVNQTLTIVTTGTVWHFITYTPDSIYCTSGSEYQINVTIKENPESLQSNVKRVIGIIVGLLKDSVDSFPASKRARIKKFIKK